MKARQRQLKGGSDRFIITVPEEVGELIRAKALEKRLSLSAYLGLIIEEHLEKEEKISDK